MWVSKGITPTYCHQFGCAVNIGHMTIKGLSLSVKENRVESQVRRATTNPKKSFEDTLRLALGEVDNPGTSPSDSAHNKRQVLSAAEESNELQGFVKSTPTHRAPCDLNDDF